MRLRLHDGFGGTLAEVETDDLPAQNIWIERVEDGHTFGSLFFEHGAIVLGQYDDTTRDWEERSRLVETEDQIVVRADKEGEDR